MAQILKITFNEDLSISQGIWIEILNGGFTPPVTMPIYETWVELRQGANQVSLGTPLLIPGETSAINFLQAFTIDWLSSFGFTAWREVNDVFLKLPFDYLQFSSFESTNLNVEFLIVTAETQLQIESAVFSQASINPCANIKVSVTTNLLADEVTLPIPITNNTTNPIVFELPRNQIVAFDFNRNDAINNVVHNVGFVAQLPGFLNLTSANINIINTPNGGNVAVVIDANLLQLQYSLDGTNWQTDNSFNSLLDGLYTLHVKDQFGCVKTLDFEVSLQALYLPYFYISKSNSIRFANRITWGDAANYKNDENTLSCEVEVKRVFKQIQLFQTSDIITTQFKSNYGKNVVKIIKEDLSEVNVPVLQKSNNIGLSDSRDARKYDLGNGKTGVYFTSGNVYNFNTGIPTGETHSLNGTLPYWAKAGNYIKIASSWFVIEDIIYDETKNADVLIISSNYTGVDVSLVVGCLYNKFDYEIYEFVIDMLPYMDQNIKVKIIASDTNFDTITLISEQINVAVRQHKTVEINYWNDDNTDIFYSTGIKHKIRLLLQKKSGVSEDENEILKTDNTAVMLSSQLYEVDEFTFEPLTKELWRKLLIALSCKHVIIDEVGYVKTESGFETEGPLEKSNLYVLKAKMIKNSGAFKSSSDGAAEFDYTNTSIPGLIDIGNNGFMEY